MGQGGMGEVYRARDTRLGRDVALKTLLSSAALDPDRLARFDQEARATAALNHPNILAVYDVGTHDGIAYVVSELLEGETLREALAGSPLPPRQATDYAMQIAHGLAAAHEKSIVHRDLKPENLFVTRDGRVKILDFGLAKLTQSVTTSSTMAPTGAVGTAAGMLLGTIGYMAPEQIRGTAVDHRADVFAFGAVFYEMLTGSRAFHGQSPADTISAILKEEPPALAPGAAAIAAPLQRVVQRCLEKTPERRFHSMLDVAYAIEAATVHSGSAPLPKAMIPTASPWRSKAVWLLAMGTATILVAAGAYVAGRVTTPPWEQDTGVVRFVLPLPDGATLPTGLGSFAVSPDGQRVAVLLRSGATQNVWIRALDEFDMRPVAGTEGATNPALFWSPNGRRIAFLSGGLLKHVDIEGGPVQVVCRCAGAGLGTWAPDGTILLGGQGEPIRQVGASGGDPMPLTRFETGDTSHASPRVLPDGRRFLFAVIGSEDRRGLYVASLSDGEGRRLVPNATRGELSGDYLVYSVDRTVLAHRVDVDTLTPTGDSFVVSDDVRSQAGMATLRATWSASSGTLVFQAGRDESQLTWFDRAGRRLGTLGEPGTHETIALSRDGSRVAFGRAAGETTFSLWTADVRRGVTSRLTAGRMRESDPAWSPAGDRIAFNSIREDGKHLFAISSAGGEPEMILQSAGPQLSLDDWSHDGRHLLYHDPTRMMALELGSGREPVIVSHPEAFRPDEGAFSPDGRAVAYNSTESGRPEVFIEIFPPTGEKWQVSGAGGVQPRWARGGNELYYLALDGTMMVAEITSLSPMPVVGAGRPLFQTDLLNPTTGLDQYAVTSDGERFLILNPIVDERELPLRVVLGWERLLP